MSSMSFRSFHGVVPSDSVSIQPTVAIYVGGAGNLVVVGREGNVSTPTTFVVSAGALLHIEATYVMFTGTTATGIVALR